MSVVFAYPYNPPHAQEVVLRNPELGDSRQLNLKTMIKQNMLGLIYTHKKTPTNSKLLLVFKTLERAEAEALKTFYRNYLGQIIEYTDYDSVRWQVRMANDSLVITVDKDNCSYDATLELLTL